MSNPLISIIIPSFNRADLIVETLNSVLEQTYTNWECIIVDDGSTDNTAEIIANYIKKDTRFRYHQRPIDRPKGGNAARNYGFEICKGDLIQWFDSDDLMHSELLEKKVKLLDQRQDSDYCLCRMAAFYTSNNIQTIIKETAILSEDLLNDYLKGVIVVGTPTVLWRRNILIDTKIFDEFLKQSQDLEFNSRMFNNNKNACFINDVLIFYRSSIDSISKNFYLEIEKYFDSFLEVRKRILSYDKENEETNIIIIKSILGIFRYCLARKNYYLCEKIIFFIRENNCQNSIKYKLEKVFLFYRIFKILGRGDTKFKKYLKI